MLGGCLQGSSCLATILRGDDRVYSEFMGSKIIVEIFDGPDYSKAFFFNSAVISLVFL